ncbi:MAG: ComEC/Rec2 family competence protein, partial [bacterium]
MRGRIFYSICFGFIIGIFFSSFSKFGFSIFSLTIVLSFSLLLSQIFTKNKAIITLIAVFIISFGLGTLRYSVADISRGEAVFEFLEQKITAVGEVIDEPRLTQQNQQIILQPDKINGQNVAENDKIIVSTASYPVVNYGDKISVTGVLKKPENFKNNNRTFDYVNYLSKDDIFYQISFANVKVVSSDNGSYLISTLLKIKNSFLNSISRVLPDPESSYLGGVLLGAKSSLPKDWQEYFRLAGVSHLVALSGYNISIVAEYIVLMFSFLSQRLALSFGGFGIVLFVLMTGASPTAIRAGIMACLVIWAKFIGRQYNIHRAIIVAAVL